MSKPLYRYRLCELDFCLLDHDPPISCHYADECPKAAQKPLRGVKR